LLRLRARAPPRAARWYPFPLPATGTRETAPGMETGRYPRGGHSRGPNALRWQATLTVL